MDVQASMDDQGMTAAIIRVCFAGFRHFRGLADGILLGCGWNRVLVLSLAIVPDEDNRIAAGIREDGQATGQRKPGMKENKYCCQPVAHRCKSSNDFLLREEEQRTGKTVYAGLKKNGPLLKQRS
jgi:hypothetical protein